MPTFEAQARQDEAADGDERDPAPDDIFTALDELDELDEAEGGDGGHTAPQGPAFPQDLRDQYALPFAPQLSLSPRAYQREALDDWLAAGGRGMVVLPTGAGKTVVALAAMARLAVRTLVVVPTIELLRQWHTEIIARLGAPDDAVGMVGGGERAAGPITVITYDSAAMRHRTLDGYGLLVCDEAHHLPARSYRAIAKRCAAPWRLGLSATLERADGGHADLDALLGPVVFERQAEVLSAQRHIAAYRERRVYVDLTPEEELRYASLMAEWRWYIATRRAQLGGGSQLFAALVRRSGFDPAARRALRAHHEARLVALNAGAKLATIEELLRRHAHEKVIVFSEYTDMVDRISQSLLIPAITYRTPAAERRALLQGFRSGALTKLATGRVLNEGVDVPDASVAIVASGSSSLREYVQRLGRVLRPKPGEAVLYELISRRTTEPGSARRRRPKRAATPRAAP